MDTVMEVVPTAPLPGTKIYIVSRVEVLRDHCRGRVYPELQIEGLPIINLPEQRAAIHDDVGTFGPYRYKLDIPNDAPRGASATFRRRTDRWCNLLQELFFHMHEVHEVRFMLAP